MSVLQIGNLFPPQNALHKQEQYIIKSLTDQILTHFPGQRNLIINTLWFGPQFNDDYWKTVQAMIQDKSEFDNLFWAALVDPLYMMPDQLSQIEQGLSVKKAYYIGTGFESSHNFNIGALSCYDDFYNYNIEDMLLKEVKHLFLCYNRKPKPHRIELVEKIYANNLNTYGICSLGKNSANYDASEGVTTDLFLAVDNDPPEKYSTFYTDFGGIPFDLLSLGRLDIWQNHFLNIVSETEFKPWDNLFVSEKTWKPIIGLRPFIVNGQTKIYKWLRNQGFKTY
jgi:hypothetical protein